VEEDGFLSVDSGCRARKVTCMSNWQLHDLLGKGGERERHWRIAKR
jgi:hypothetical protein